MSEGEDNGEDAQDEVLDMPPPWSPKLFLNKDKFNDRCPNGEKTVFYDKTKVDFYSECKQPDGLVKRTTLYKDYNRLITQEVRSEYACRMDKLKVRRRFPYQFKLVEHYESQEDTHWKKLIQVDGHDRKLWYYHHRNKDGLIYRHEQIGFKKTNEPGEKEMNKTLEQYKNRPDKLIYRSVVYDPEQPDPQALRLQNERNYGKDVTIKKMTQKFELDHESKRPPNDQIKKTEFNLKTKAGEISLFYHYQKGKITNKSQSYCRADLIGNATATMEQVGEKDNEETKEQKINKEILEMELKCHQGVQEAEKVASMEVENKQQIEKYIQQQRVSFNAEEVFDKILQKSLKEKARDKMKMGKKKDDNEAEKHKEPDYLAHILKNLGYQDGEQLEEEACIAVKNEALRNLKDRLLTRAEIIQRRLEEEQAKLEEAYSKLKRKGEGVNAQDQTSYETEVAKTNFRMDILVERSTQHYKNSLEKFQILDEKLKNDARLAKLNQKTAE